MACTLQSKINWRIEKVSQNKLLTYLWYLNFRYTLKGLWMIQKFNNDNDDED